MLLLVATIATYYCGAQLQDVDRVRLAAGRASLCLVYVCGCLCLLFVCYCLLYFVGEPWLRTDGVNTNGAAAKVINQCCRSGKKGMPWHFWENKVHGSTKKSLIKTRDLCSNPVRADPVCPFPNLVDYCYDYYYYYYYCYYCYYCYY